MFVSANVRPSWEELAVDLIHWIGPGETGQEVVFLQEHRHFIWHPSRKLSLERNVKSRIATWFLSAASQQRSGREAIVLLCTEHKIANFTVILAAKKYLVSLALGIREEVWSLVHLNKLPQNIWESNRFGLGVL